MKINIIDLFAGCGGLTDGFLQTNKYKTLAAVDWEFPTVQTLRKRLSEKWNYDIKKENILHFDIQKTDKLLHGYDDPFYGKSSGLIKLVANSNVDLVIGGPPCQAYSIAGRVRDANGMKDDYRNFLFESYVKIVAHFTPKAFVFENVEGILSAKPGGIPIIIRIKEAFNKIGYDITDNLRKDALFDTSYYGVPQKRKRVIIFGVKKEKNSQNLVAAFYEKMRLIQQDEPTIVDTAFANLPKIYPLESPLSKPKTSHKVKSNGIPQALNHIPRFHNKRDIEIFKTLAWDIQSGKNKYTSTQALIKLYEEKTGKSSKFHKYHVIKLGKPSNTIPAHLYKDGLRHIHPDCEQARSITVREAARIQTFDDDFEFLGSRGDQYKMIGNAVPPLFAKKIAQIINQIL